MSRAGLNRTTGLATLTMVLAAEAPDSDIALYLGGTRLGFQHHRGFTHTFLGAAVIAAVVLAFVYLFYRLWLRSGQRTLISPRWGLLYLYAVLAAESHILLDFTNTYGVRPFSPFKPTWYSWDTVYIIEPLILGAFLLAVIAPPLFALINTEIGAKKKPFRGRPSAIAALIFVVLVWGVRAYYHQRAVEFIESRTYLDEKPIKVQANPYMVTPFRWMAVVETKDFYQNFIVDAREQRIMREEPAITHFKPEETEFTRAAKASPLGRAYMDWARFPFTETQITPERQGGGAIVYIFDLRYAYPERKGHPLGMWVELGPDLKVKGEDMGPRPVGD